MNQTEYVHRILIIVPESLRDDANQLALVTGESPYDDQTFQQPTHTKDGVSYAVASTVVKPAFIAMARQPLVAQDHAPNADLEAAQRALDATRWNEGPYKNLISIYLDEAIPDELIELGLEVIEIEQTA